MKTKAAILVESRKPLVIDDIELPETLEVGQVLVKVLYTSICGAQINEIDAIKGPDKFLPHLLGHEGSGIVQDIGPGVQHVKPGDHVVLHWRPSLGIQAKPASYRWRDAPLNAGWVTTFQELTVVSENRLTPIPANFDMKIAPLFGCAVTTALGVVCNDAKVKIGDSVLIFGAGGVGLHIVQFAKMAGAYPIVVVEPNSDRRKIAVVLGADKAIEPEMDHWLGQFEKVIETTGKKEVIETAYLKTYPKGTCVLVGVPSEAVSIYTLPLHLGKTLTGSEGGQSKPHIDIPKLIRLVVAAKRLDLGGFFQQKFSLDQINHALGTMRRDGGRFLIDLTSEAP